MKSFIGYGKNEIISALKVCYEFITKFYLTCNYWAIAFSVLESDLLIGSWPLAVVESLKSFQISLEAF